MTELTLGQQARALVASITAHHVNLAAECQKIDRAHELSARRRSTTGLGSGKRDKTKRATSTVYDLAESNSGLAKALRAMQMRAYK